MLDLYVPELPAGPGEWLTRLEYKRDFGERRAVVQNGNSWKLERRQHFEEVDASRDALRRGDWAEALRLFEADRDEVRAAAQAEAAKGNAFYRLRVVEEPLTPYMQWELHWLALRAECGHQVRVLPAASVLAAEADGMLPELTLIDGRTLFRVVYTDEGATEGAVRYTDPEIVRPWENYLRELYGAAEDILTYFPRAVAPLPPPPAA
ncbi:DUF6879 family protein [Streptomyces sp. NPDC021224]|uniref:DUF6879 family protein n=1 Tax=unclassified Streptomyces TaxID=2593676 RepID=UPI0037978734